MFRRSLSVAVLALAASAVLVVPGSPSASAATDPGTARPFPEADGACYTKAGPKAMAPNQMAALYGLAPLWEAGYTGQGRSIAIIDPGEIPDTTEVAQFQHCFGVDSPVTTTVIGEGAEPAVSGEATLDVTVALSAAPGLDHVYQFASRGDVENPLLVLLEAALDPANTGGVQVDAISTSFSMCESRAETGSGSYTADYVDLMNEALEKAAAAGVTLFADAGDSGSSACAQHPVVEGDPEAAVAAVAFPGTSPWAVSVGGSQFEVTKQADGAGEVTVERTWNEVLGSTPGARMAGGGGTSTIYEAPTWQQGFAPTSRRSVPDLTALAGTPGYSWSGDSSEWYGTSAATPYTAGGWLVVLSALDANDLASPGFFGPVLYDLARADHAGIFRDITVGNNDVWGQVGCCDAGTGYDEASGLGSIRWDRVATALGVPAPVPPSTTTTTAVPATPPVTPRFTG